MEAVLKRAATLDDVWDCGALPGGLAAVPCDEPAYEVLEHVCHEMAHAVLTGVALGPKLSQRVADHIRTMAAAEQNTNEVETFAVVMRVFAVLGLEVDRAVMVDATKAQVPWSRREIRDRWNKFRKTNRCEVAVQGLLAVLHEEQP